ncbi:hypothetical protein HJC99_04015 [Candidatus Saccharibacteria bacterium]|nr:hypothetical protein [Candidatus Saccharibacteria bacterium]
MKYRLLIGLAAILAVTGIYVRSTNAHHAATLATALVASDNAAADTTASLASLKTYVHSHTGAHASFTLQASYNRVVAEAQAAAAATATNSQIYTAAQAACGGKTDSITQAKCNAQFLSQHLVNVPASAPVSPPLLSNYQYKLTSPLWTPDPAGWLLLGSLVVLVVGSVGIIRSKK